MLIVFYDEVLKRVCLGITCKIAASDSDVRSIQRLSNLSNAIFPLSWRGTILSGKTEDKPVRPDRFAALKPIRQAALFSSPVEKMPGFPPLPHTVMPRLDLGISRHQRCGCHEASG